MNQVQEVVYQLARVLLSVAAEPSHSFAEYTLQLMWGRPSTFVQPHFGEQFLEGVCQLASEAERIVFVDVFLVNIEEEKFSEFQGVRDALEAGVHEAGVSKILQSAEAPSWALLEQLLQSQSIQIHQVKITILKILNLIQGIGEILIILRRSQWLEDEIAIALRQFNDEDIGIANGQIVEGNFLLLLRFVQDVSVNFYVRVVREFLVHLFQFCFRFFVHVITLPKSNLLDRGGTICHLHVNVSREYAANFDLELLNSSRPWNVNWNRRAHRILGSNTIHELSFLPHTLHLEILLVRDQVQVEYLKVNLYDVLPVFVFDAESLDLI